MWNGPNVAGVQRVHRHLITRMVVSNNEALILYWVIPNGMELWVLLLVVVGNIGTSRRAIGQKKLFAAVVSWVAAKTNGSRVAHLTRRGTRKSMQKLLSGPNPAEQSRGAP